jgi:putative membrane-bound dehydrogenase-like protein
MLCRSFLAALALVALGAFDVSAQESAWKPVNVPQVWKSPPAGKEGYSWYRCVVRVPENWKGRPCSLFVEAVDDAREAYANGTRLGALGSLPPAFRSGLGETTRLKLPAAALQPGKLNVIAIRVYAQQARTGFNVAAPVLFAGDEALRLQGSWSFRAGDEVAWSKLDSAASDKPLEVAVQPAAQVEKELTRLQDDAGPLSPADSMAKMKVPEDLDLELVLSEPEIAQPLSIKWDARGRMWVVEYRQYPNPAGLKMVSRDKFLRSVYDKVPPPPPNHFRGEDRVSIHEDTDGDGKYDKHKVFVDGLSLCSSVAIAQDGVWVLNPPYLLFYPDKNQDDLPDGDPEVHLEGFGIEDSHSVANSLRWGPDGWLYAGQGSTVTGDVHRPGEKEKHIVHSLGQLIWRYHPVTRKYEVFAEGGGNTFGVEIDSKGRIFSGHNGGNTRGFHYVQGGYSQKGFGKHGDLSNPYTFGYFPAMAHHDVPRFTHTFVIYEDDALPARYHGKLFGVGPLQGHVVYSDFQADRSTFKTKDLGYVLESKDTWCRPVDIQVGPDGNLYVADMYEQRIDHASHYQGRIHKESGRIYRLKAKGSKPAGATNLAKLSSPELVSQLAQGNRWERQTAQALISQRPDRAKLKNSIADLLAEAKGQAALERLWALNAAGGLTEETAGKQLDHADPYVRLWTVRILCDDGELAAPLADKLADLAYRDPNVEVRSQLASSARRLPAKLALPILKNLAGRSEDVKDPLLPLLIWWGMEAKADGDRDAVLALLSDKAFWDQPLVQEHLLERLMRRYAATGQRKDLLVCAKLLELSPSPAHAQKLMAGFEAAYAGRALTGAPPELLAALHKSGSASPTLRLRQGDPAAVADALKLVADDKADASKRQQTIEILGTIKQPHCVPVLVQVAQKSSNDALRSAAIVALQAYDDPAVAQTLVALHNDLPVDLRAVAQSVLASRAAWALRLVEAVDSKSIEPAAVDASIVRRLQLHNDERLVQLCKKHWGELPATANLDSIRAEMEKVIAVLSSASGNPYAGKKLFAAQCGKCHVLFGQGGKIGPDLTSFKRDDLRGILLNVLHPSAEIRQGYENYLVRTSDGRALNGFIAEQDPQVVVLRTVEGQTTAIPRDEIENLRALPISLMPEGLLKQLTEQQLRDLFAYVRATQPLAD